MKYFKIITAYNYFLIMYVDGIVADYVYYQVVSENPCDLPSDKYHFPSKSAEQTKVKLVFGLLFGYPTYPNKLTKQWNSSNIHQFIQYLKNNMVLN